MVQTTDKMSKEIRNLYHRYSIQKEAEDHPTSGKKWAKWEILWSFMEVQVEVSRREVRSSSSPTKETDVKRNVANSVTTKDKQAE